MDMDANAKPGADEHAESTLSSAACRLRRQVRDEILQSERELAGVLLAKAPT